MSAMSAVVASLAAAGGAVALYRLAKRRARRMRAALDKARKGEAPYVDYERDPSTGVYKPKS